MLPQSRRDLVADLYQRQRHLWDAVLEARERRSIDSVVGLPSSDLDAFPCPEGVLELQGKGSGLPKVGDVGPDGLLICSRSRIE